MKSLNAQFGLWQAVQSESFLPGDEGGKAGGRPTAPSEPKVARVEDTAIVITSSWIPSHPSTFMVETVLNSTSKLIGLSPGAPIIITVDYFRYTDFKGAPKYLEERIDKLEEYTINLYNRYMTNPRVHVVTNAKQLHIGGSVLKAMDLVERHYPDVRYLYYLQHDFFFFKDTNHTALVEAMDEYSHRINYVRFPKRSPWDFSRSCGTAKTIQHSYNATATRNAKGADNRTSTEAAIEPKVLKLYPTKDYSDNNHLARFSWYKDAIGSLEMLRRAPEDPLQKRAYEGCRADRPIGLYLYPETNIAHLDGRHRSVPQ
ncbi:hypothetical protein ACHAWF_002332 [Thalassiosira exigua]